MKKAALIFPHQLFADHPLLSSSCDVVIIWEHPVFFTRYNYHKHKLIFHKASVAEYIASKLVGYTVHVCSFADDFVALCKRLSVGVIDYCSPYDHTIEDDLARLAKSGIVCTEQASPYFLDMPWMVAQLKASKHWQLGAVYRKQRERLRILMDAYGKPLGGAFSLDAENREPFPKDGIAIPKPYKPHTKESVQHATAWVEQHFPDNPGRSDTFCWAVTHECAVRALGDFLERRFAIFGLYQDAFSYNEPFSVHSLISPYINSGLLTPAYVVKRALAYVQSASVPLSSVEGFIRQVIGWREYVGGIYAVYGKKQKEQNIFNHQRTISAAWYTGSTGLRPVDEVIERINQYAYAHHIERLMILANAMLLMEINPKEAHRWFMEMFIDAYDWVMVPNVMGMGLFADGGSMVTKPYCSSSSYLRKMGRLPKEPWCDDWDALFWYFVLKNYDYLASIPRMQYILAHARKMTPEKSDDIASRAKRLLG